MILQFASFTFGPSNDQGILFLFTNKVIGISIKESKVVWQYESKEGSIFRHLAINNNSSSIAIGCSTKEIILISIKNSQLITKFKIPNSITGIIYGSDAIIVSDNGGTVGRYLVKEESFEILLGHLSQITSIGLGLNEKAIFSADKDAKVRMSQYPEGFLIERYFLGHLEFISKIFLFQQQGKEEILVCGGGDSYLTFWNVETGELLAKVDFLHLIESEECCLNRIAILNICKSIDNKNILFSIEGCCKIFSICIENLAQPSISIISQLPSPICCLFVDLEGNIWTSIDSKSSFLFKNLLPIEIEFDNIDISTPIGPLIKCHDRYKKFILDESKEEALIKKNKLNN